MRRAFAEYYRVLKPGRWMTVVFHNSKNLVWTAIQEAIGDAGVVGADGRTLDREQGSFSQVTAAGAVKQDLVLSAYKPNGGLVVVSTMQLADGVQYRVVGRGAEAYPNAQPAQPSLEDGYVWLMQGSA